MNILNMCLSSTTWPIGFFFTQIQPGYPLFGQYPKLRMPVQDCRLPSLKPTVLKMDGRLSFLLGELLVLGSVCTLHCQPQLLSYTQSILLWNLGLDQSESVQKTLSHSKDVGNDQTRKSKRKVHRWIYFKKMVCFSFCKSQCFKMAWNVKKALMGSGFECQLHGCAESSDRCEDASMLVTTQL